MGLEPKTVGILCKWYSYAGADLEGNVKTARKVTLLKTVLTKLGIEGERVPLEWISASEHDCFAAIVDDMTEKVSRLGSFSGNGDGQNG